jgi:hypothetical protein
MTRIKFRNLKAKATETKHLNNMFSQFEHCVKPSMVCGEVVKALDSRSVGSGFEPRRPHFFCSVEKSWLSF